MKEGFFQQKETSGYRSVPYGEYRSRALRVSSKLRSLGLGPGDKLLIVSENCPEWGIVALGALNLGVVLVPVAAMSTATELVAVIDRAQPKFCVLSATTTAFRTIDRAKLPPYFVLKFQAAEPLADFIADESEDEVNPFAVQGSATALLIYTSGTTGTPKGVPLSHENVITNVEDISDVIDINDSDVVVSVLPLSHMLEFTGGFLLAIYRGVRIVYVRSLRASDIMQAMKDHGCTILLAVPLLFEIIARTMQQKMEGLPKPLQKIFAYGRETIQDRPRMGRALLAPLRKAFGGKIRFFVAGGAKLQPWVYEFFESIGIKILQGYGLTETSPVLAVSGVHNASARHVGRPVRNVEVGIFKDDGDPCEVGSEGEVWARGKSVFLGYENSDHNKETFVSDWFRTGDLGVLDSDGFLEITGRKKDIIVTPGGKNVYPEEIESVLSRTGLFLENAVVAMEDESGHEKVCLIVRPDRTKFNFNTEAELRGAVRSSVGQHLAELSDYKQPKQIELFESDFPKTHTRKVKRHELRTLVQAAIDSTAIENAGADKELDSNFLNPLNKLERSIGEAISGITRKPFDSLSKSDKIASDLALDSLTLVEVVGIFEKTFVTQVESLEFTKIETLGDLLEELQSIVATAGKDAKLRRDPWFSNFNPMIGAKWYWAVPRMVLNIFLRIFMQFFCQFQVVNASKVPMDGPLIFTPNHSSHFDVLSVATSLRFLQVRTLFAVAAKDYFFDKEWKSLLVRLALNAIPFDRKRKVEESMHRCKEILDSDGSLVIFPEGTRSLNGSIQEFKAGVGQLLCHNSKVRAVPVYIEGAHKLFPKGASFPRPGKLKIVYGEAISFSDLEPTQDNFSKIANRLESEVRRLQAENKSN